MQDRASTTSPPREVRVFLSSTFRDMHEEREDLVKRIFPALRRLCEARGVTWAEVDLRWGVTEEQKAEGKVLPICLAEIQRCPYFIGLLGERYGWVPDEIAPALVQQQPWLAEHFERSVTELEVVHGVLGDPAMAEHGFFYFRDPDYVESLPPGEQASYREDPSAEEVSRYGAPKAARRSAERREKLKKLKRRIRESGFRVRENYPNPRAMGDMVLADLTEVIDRLFPAGSEPSPLERESSEHEAFAAGFARVYISRAEYYDRLDSHVNGDGHPLVVMGESGVGKSALLANWALRYRAMNPGKLVLMHFIGVAQHGADWAAIVIRIIHELARHRGIPFAIPERLSELREVFPMWLLMAAAKGGLVLVLDGLDQLEDRDQALDLNWLPRLLPPNVRLIVSAGAGRPLEELRKRGWPALEVELLTPEERERLVIDYLAWYSKTLSQARVERLARTPQAANPLYLRSLLEELRVWGEHETLDHAIEHYLEAETIDGVYERMLARYERDYERDNSGLVREAMSLLWAARRGLSEVELLDLLGGDGEPLPGAHWSPLYLAAEPSFANHWGVLGFSNEHVREAVRRRYLPTEREEQDAHSRLAGYFESRESSPRKIDELPWQLSQAGRWDGLYGLLGDLSFLEKAWKASPFEVERNWAAVEAQSSLRMVDAYRPVLNFPEEHLSELSVVATLLTVSGHSAEASSLSEAEVSRYRQLGDGAGLAGALRRQAAGLFARRELDRAVDTHLEEERISRELGDEAGLASSLGGQALIHMTRGDLDRAAALHREEEKIWRRLGRKDGLHRCLANQALVLKGRGDLDGALTLLKEVEEICSELGDQDGLQRSLGNRANLLQIKGDVAGALALHKQEEQLCRELGLKQALLECLNNEAAALFKEGDPKGALICWAECEQICREIGDKNGLQRCLGNLAVLCALTNDRHNLRVCLLRQESLCRELGNNMDLARCQALQTQLLTAGERVELSKPISEEEDLARFFDTQAVAAAAQSNWPRAAEYFGRAAILLRESGNLDRLEDALGQYAEILLKVGKVRDAAVVLEEKQRVARARREAR